jgi:phage terminase large subunit-like protein
VDLTGLSMQPTPPDASPLAKLALLASQLQEKPWLNEVFADSQPEAYEQVLQLASSPFFQWKPFGYTIDDNPCQFGWLQEWAHQAWLVAGNRTGKTVSTWMKFYSSMMGIDMLTKQPVPHERFEGKTIDGWIVSDTEDTSIDIIQRTLVREILGDDESGFLWNFVDDSCQWTEAGGWKGSRFATTNGSRCTFKFSTQKRKTFQGTSRTIVWADEEQPKDIMEECRTRIADCNGYLWGTLTPVYEKLRGIPWVYHDVYLKREEKGIPFHNYSLLHNPHITEEVKASLMREWDEDSREVRIHGMFVPMGIQLAFPLSMIRTLREGITDGDSGHLRFSEDGEVELVQI